MVRIKQVACEKEIDVSLYQEQKFKDALHQFCRSAVYRPDGSGEPERLDYFDLAGEQRAQIQRLVKRGLTTVLLETLRTALEGVSEKERLQVFKSFSPSSKSNGANDIADRSEDIGDLCTSFSQMQGPKDDTE